MYNSILQTNECCSIIRSAQEISLKSSSRLIVIYTKHATPRVYVIVFKHVIRVIIALHVPEALKGRVNTLLEALDYVHLCHHLASRHKHNHILHDAKMRIIRRWWSLPIKLSSQDDIFENIERRIYIIAFSLRKITARLKEGTEFNLK